MPKREKTKYPGVFYRETKRVGGPGTEKVYYIVFKQNGKVFEEKVGKQFIDDMTPAKAASIRAERIEGKRESRKAIREAQEALKDAESNRWTVERLWEKYTVSRNLKGIVTDQNRFQNYIKPSFGDKEPQEIAPLDVDRLRINLLKKRKPQTVKHVLVLLKRIVNFGVKLGLCEGLAFQMDMPKVRNEKTEDLTPEQLARLLKAISEDPCIHAANIMRMALFTGMRRGELFRLRWDDIDFERGFIKIRDPKGGENQTIPLNDPAREVLHSHIRTKSPYVFFGRRGQQRIEIKHQVNRIKKAARLPKDFRPIHGLRHVYASMLASSGQVDMYTLQKLLTHKTPIMTQRYAHLRDETLKKASNLAGELVNNAVNAANKAQKEAANTD